MTPGARRPLLAPFALRAALWLALLIALPIALPAARGLYVVGFHAQANALFRSLGGGRAVRLSPPEAPRGGDDTRMVGFDRSRLEKRFEASFPVFWRAYTPAAGVSALILAMPMPWRRRAPALLAGALTLHALALALTGVLAFALFGEVDAGRETWLSRIAKQLITQDLPRCVVVLVVWVLLAQPGRWLASGASDQDRPR